MYSVQTSTSNGTLDRVVIGIEFIDVSHIHVYRSDDPDELVEGVDFTWDGVIAIDFPSVIPNGVVVTILRRTVFDEILNLFAGGAPFLREALDENFTQVLYIAQETAESGITLDFFRYINMNNNQIKSLGAPTASTDATTKAYVDAVDTDHESRLDYLEARVPTAIVDYTATAVGGNSSWSPPYTFTQCLFMVDGVVQVPGISYNVVANTIQLIGWTFASGSRLHAHIYAI